MPQKGGGKCVEVKVALLIRSPRVSLHAEINLPGSQGPLLPPAGMFFPFISPGLASSHNPGTGTFPSAAFYQVTFPTSLFKSHLLGGTEPLSSVTSSHDQQLIPLPVEGLRSGLAYSRPLMAFSARTGLLCVEGKLPEGAEREGRNTAQLFVHSPAITLISDGQTAGQFGAAGRQLDGRETDPRAIGEACGAALSKVTGHPRTQLPKSKSLSYVRL